MKETSQAICRGKARGTVSGMAAADTGTARARDNHRGMVREFGNQ